MISERLKFCRLIQNLTQKDLSENSGLGVWDIGRIEAQNSDVRISTAVKLRDSLGLNSIDELIKPLSKAERDQRKVLLDKHYDDRKKRRNEKKAEYASRCRAKKAAKTKPLRPNECAMSGASRISL